MIRVKGKGDVDAYCLPHPPQLEHRSQSDSNRQSVLEIIALVYAIRKRIKPEGEKRYLAIVQFSRSVMSDSLRPHEPQHARPPCPSPTPGSRLLNLDLAGDCTFIPTEWQQSIAGNYSLIILQVSTLRPRDKNKMHACPNKLQVVLNTCEWIWQTNVLCYRHFRLSLENVLCFHVPVISSTWFSFGSLHCLDYKLKQNKTKQK